MIHKTGEVSEYLLDSIEITDSVAERLCWGIDMEVPLLEPLETLRNRAPWPVGRRILAVLGIVRGQGWNNTIRKATENPSKDEAKIGELMDALKSHLICGEKLVSFYKFNKTDLSAIRDKILALKVPDNDFLYKYPTMLSEAELKSAPASLVLTSVEQNEFGMGLVFSSARMITTRDHLDVKALPSAVNSTFDEYEEIIGVKTVRFQATDIVWIPSLGDTVDVRVDFPDGTLSETAVAARKQAVSQLTALVGIAIPEPLNVFPLIEKMYNDKSEGAVVELGFGTTTASLKHEKMRRRRLDLRDETYHKGGKEALDTPIEPFKISILWHRKLGKKLNSEPELTFNSNSRDAGSNNPFLDRVVIRRCMGHEDYNYVRSRIAHHLGS